MTDNDVAKSAVFALLALSAPGLALANGGWSEITPPAVNGYPTGCAYDGILASQGVPTTPYKYMLQKPKLQKPISGNPANLLIFLDGGGACWDPNTCGLNPPVKPTFYPFITEAVVDGGLVDAAFPDGTPVSPRTLETGVLNDDEVDNPFQGYTKVFMPYCTGDIFWGNNDNNYPLAINPAIIHHRGYGNLLAVLESLKNNGYDGNYRGKVVIAGTSGGAYGAIVAFVEAKKRMSKAKMYMIADSGNGIVTNGFLSKAISNWKVGGNVPNTTPTLPPILLAIVQQASFTPQGAAALPLALYAALTRSNKGDRFAQFQNAYDTVQTEFLYTMKLVDTPIPPPNLALTLAEWTLRMRAAVNLSAMASNYRFYTAAGSEHTVLVDIPPSANLGFCSDQFYEEKSAAGVPLTDWVKDMVNTDMVNPPYWRKTENWQNATCFPNCLTKVRQGCPAPTVPPQT